LLATVAALPWLAAAQTVEGTITNSVTGDGIPGANVMLFQNAGGKPAYSTVTDAQGRFTIEGVNSGSYILQYNADGYFPDGAEVDTFRVVAGGAPIRLQGRLKPMSRLSGSVVDARGDPVPRAVVQLIAPSAILRAAADDKGNFHGPPSTLPRGPTAWPSRLQQDGNRPRPTPRPASLVGGR
jgi:hypothetical protein